MSEHALNEARETLRQAEHWLADAIDSTGQTDEELLAAPGMFWAQLIAARQAIRATLLGAPR